jgi:hypothetical protein
MTDLDSENSDVSAAEESGDMSLLDAFWTDTFQKLDELPPEELRSRVAVAIKHAVEYMGVDGGHHKQWALLKVISTLIGDSNYQQLLFVRGKVGFDFDPGIE